MKNINKVDVLLGLQFGDEGKGKIVDVLSIEYDIICRFQGGGNAGHTLEFDGIKHVLNTIPSGIFRENVLNIIGNGVIIDPISFQKELEKLDPFNIDYTKRLLISKKSHLILPTHKLLDAMSEKNKGNNKIGSTLKGIGPTYMDKTGRNGLRVGDILSDNFQQKYNELIQKHYDILKFDIEFDEPFDLLTEIQEDEEAFFIGIEKLKTLQIIDSEHYINNALIEGKKILAEGAQGTMLDIDFGTYPFVTSSSTITAGVCSGLGIAPSSVGKVIGITKAYMTRVGSGPFVTELNDEVGDSLQKLGNEFGSTTGRSRRCGWIDLVQLKYSIMVNGITELNLMKSDVLDTLDTIKVCTHYLIDGEPIDYFPYDITNAQPIYTEIKGWNVDTTKLTNFEDVPFELKQYISYLEYQLEIPITIVSVGPDRIQTLKR